jgi:elongation factor P--(R)-beta-lysine ligase
MTEIEILTARHELLRGIREFFYERGYLEVETPSLMKTAPPDPHIDPLEVFVGGKGPFYLHTSPEVHMKRLLQYGHSRLFQMCRVFRVEDLKEIHNVEFTMLEWYREGSYVDIMDEVQDLVVSLTGKLCSDNGSRFAPPYRTFELDRLFLDKAGIDPFPLDRDTLFLAMQKTGFKGLDERDGWNELFFKLLIQEVEGRVREEKPYFIMDWPLSISTMAKRKDLNKVERFEFYIDGVEIGNGYSELLDSDEQRARFLEDNQERTRINKATFPTDEPFLTAISRLHEPHAGVAIGVDRLLMKILGLERIDEVIFHRFTV